ncbi:TetR/AcrR family transcriptional regulator [Hyalangium minutum]|uniref:Transcriptional regulator, TetR family protein n=1 Tax=Hyalangium minutum TaxID=394096 RepID=A0A085WAE9_9BACT|nr:TetR/AcrR family transcriptional regulator [Hyalangium minutum]KFE64662.1 Transcriptional regulator, TetR family protein [Hyalangium minutum]
MKVSREQAEANRARIIEVAGELFREKGFDGIGVADLMKAAGLTHGGFYGHFKSKDDLAAQACEQAMAGTLKKWNKYVAESSDEPLALLVSQYLSTRHRDNPSKGCLFASLGGETVRQSSTVRRTVTAGLRSMIDLLTGLVPGRSKAARREKAIATMSGMVGALVLARAVDDNALSEEILRAAVATFGQKQTARAEEEAGAS